MGKTIKIENVYEIDEEITRLYLGHGVVTIIDTSSVSLVSKYHWYANWYSKRSCYGILNKSFHNKTIVLSRLLMGFPDNLVVDHINRDTLDNRKCNLRVCTMGQNSMNKKKRVDGKASQYKCVYYRPEMKSKPWHAEIKTNNKSTHLGYFATEIEAALAYNEKAREIFGEFANPNIINSEIEVSK